MSGHFVSYFPDSGQIDQSDQSSQIDETTISELREIAGRYPHARSALMPMLHLVQSVDNRVSPKGIEVCADILGITTAQVSAVATFYTMYRRRPTGKHHVGICQNTMCAVMGGDILMECAKKKLGIEEGQTTPDGQVSLESIECNAGCDYAPVVMVNWEFFDSMNPETTEKLLDALMNDEEVVSTRGATLTSWKATERVLAGFSDGRADEGPSAGPNSLLGKGIAAERGWTAPDPAALAKPGTAGEAGK